MKYRYPAHLCLPLWLGVVAACGGGGGGPNHVENPMAAPGGGVQEGAVDGELNVFVVDQDDAPVAGAMVRVGEAAAAAPLTGTTDASGLVTFEDETLKGAQTITVTASGFAAQTWIGANGAVVTIPLTATGAPPAPPSATVTGTIDGWTSLPAPPDGHVTIGLVLYSFTQDLADPANSLAQGTGANNVPANACVRVALLPPSCEFEVKVRTGPATLYGMVVDLDTKNTPNDDRDDTFTIVGFLEGPTINLNAGGSQSGVTMTRLTDVENLTAGFPTLPAGLSEVAAIPMIDKGEERFPLAFPGLTPEAPTAAVPPLTGLFAGGSVNLLVTAGTGTGAADPSALQFLRGVGPSGMVTIPEFLAPPTALSATGGTYGFTPTSGANLHVVDLQNGDGQTQWGVALLDGSTSFSLPTLSPSPLPAGTLTMKVTALELAGSFDPEDFVLDDFEDAIERASTQAVEFMP